MTSLQLFIASWRGELDKVRQLLRDDTGQVDVNWQNSDYRGCGPLHFAAAYDQAEVISALLAHPRIEVNLRNRHGGIPFRYACKEGRARAARLLLEDPRTRPNDAEDDGSTPLFFAAAGGHNDVIKEWIASGREMDLGGAQVFKSHAIGAAQQEGKADTVALLTRFRDNPAETRQQVRRELGWYRLRSAEVFALVVFNCDGLLAEEAGNTQNPGARRFFRMARALPMEVQMILCHRVAGSMALNISRQESEAAFTALAKKYSP